MSDSAKEMKPAAIVGPSLREKKRKKRLSVDSGNSTSQMLCAPGEHAISDNTPSGAVPLHPSSFSSSPRGDVGSSEVDVDVASSEEESVAELGDFSEVDCSSVEDFHGHMRRRQDVELDKLSGGVVAVAKKISDQEFQAPAPIPTTALKCARFSEPADDSESLIDHPMSSPATAHTTHTEPRSNNDLPSSDAKASSINTNTTKTDAFVVPPHAAEESDSGINHSPKSLPRFKEPRSVTWVSSHAANAPSEDRSASLMNVLLQALPPNFDSETQLPALENEYHSLIRLNLWSVIDGHGGGSVATYASEVLLPHVAASIARALGCAIVSRGVCLVNGQLRDANALDLDGLIKTSDRRSANPNSIHYRSPFEASDSDEEGANADPLSQVRDDETTHVSRGQESQASNTEASIASSLPERAASVSSGAVASVSSVKTSVKTAASAAPRDAPIGTHSPSEVAAITRAITESFLAVDEGWINSIDPVATRQTSCQSNGRWNSGACALTVFTVQRLEWTSVSEEHSERELRGPAKRRGHDTSQNKDAARRRMLDYATRAKSASSLSTISSTSSLTTTDGRVNTSGLESEITETEGEDDDHSTDDENQRRRNPLSRPDRMSSFPKESLISAPGGCSCHCYRAYDALLYTAHVGDCRAVLLGSAPPRTIKVHGSSSVGHPEATDDESSHHSSDETECLSSSDHDADSSDDEDNEMEGKLANAATTTSSYMSYMRHPARRQSRRRAKDEFGMNAPFIALPPLEDFRSVEIEIDSDGDLRDRHQRKEGTDSSDNSSSSSTQNSKEMPPPILLPPVTRPIDLTTDHSAYNPAEVTAVLRRCNNAPRAISAGVGGGIKRVAGSLAVTRALGDAYLKTPLLSFNPYKRHAPYITGRPEVNCRPIVKDGDKVLILATDGVWERASGEDVLRWVRNYYAERIAETERRKNRRLNQSDRCSNDGSVTGRNKDDDSDERDDDLNMNRKRDIPRSPSPPTKRRKLELGRRTNGRGSAAFDSQRNNTVADVIVRRVLNKVRRARNISSLHALMSLPPGRARRSKHDDITACVVDLSEFVS